MLPAHSWKRPLQLNTFGGGANRSSFTMANKYLFADLCCLRAERATRPRLSLLHPQMRGLMLPVHCWKRSLQHNTCSGDANGSGLPAASNYLFASLLLSTSGEGDEATSPSFASANVGIDASSTLLEALIAT